MFTLYIGQDLLDLLTLYLTVNFQEKKKKKIYFAYYLDILYSMDPDIFQIIQKLYNYNYIIIIIYIYIYLYI